MTRPGEARPSALPWIVSAIAIAVLGAWLVKDAVAWSAIGWMYIYQVEDFHGPGEILNFFRDLRIAIPPWLAAIEFLDYRLTGTNDWIPVYLYRIALVGAYVVAIALTYPSHRRLAVAVPLTAIFLWSASLIHRAGPNVYDAIYPFLILGFFLALRSAPKSELAAFLAGLLLSLAELTRPFVLLLLPVLLLGVLLNRRLRRARRLVAFLLPVLLLSGGWHAYQLAAHGQVFWSNHGGFNLQRAWTMVDYPPLLPESTPPKIAPDRMDNFNTPEHAANSRRIEQAILNHIVAHPLSSAMHALERLSAVISGEIVLHGEVPASPVIAIYQVVVKYPALWILLGALAIAATIVGFHDRARRILTDDGNLLILITAATLAIIALTEAGEEARFMIALLPALAAVPVPHLEFRPIKRGVATRRVAWATAIVAVLAIEVFAQGAVRRSTGIEVGGSVVVEPRSDGDGTLKVGLLHVRGGRWKDRERDAASIAGCMKGLDVVGLNGVNGKRPFSGQPDQAETLSAKAGMFSMFAPTERRWWSDWYGNALLAGVTVNRWRYEPLPSPRTPPRRNMLIAEIDLLGLPVDRPANLLVTQVDFGYDNALQLGLAIERFLKLPVPSVLMGELNTTRDAAGMRELLALPETLAFTVNLPSPVGPRPVDWIVTRGFRHGFHRDLRHGRGIRSPASLRHASFKILIRKASPVISW